MKAKISEVEELQLPVFYLEDNKNIVKNLTHIIEKYTGEYKYRYGDAYCFTKDSLGNEITESEFGNVLVIKYKDQTFYVPLGLSSYDKKEVLKRVSSINFKKIGREKALQNLMESMYKYDDMDQMLRISVLIYKNMDPKRRKTKNGKELKKFIDEFCKPAISWAVFQNDVRMLKDLIEVAKPNQDVLTWIFQTDGIKAAPETRACLLGAMKEFHGSEKMFEI